MLVMGYIKERKDKLKTYFKNIKNILLYFDFQPLLFFWVISDILNNQVLWTTLDYWTEVGQPYTYWLYFAYLIGSTGMIVFLYNTKWLSVFVGYHLILTLFATIRYIVNIYQTMDTEPLTLVDVKNLSLTCWYAFMWSWILFKLKRELLINTVKHG